jgi:ATP-dependent exoDNAse (exonuclease V) alpha subunit
VVAVNPAENLLTVEKQNGEQVAYDPKRLHGVSVYREMEREFSVGDRIQFTAPDKRLQVANRDLATIEQITPAGEISARLDDGRAVTFSNPSNAHFDHGYAVTSHSSQGLTADRVLVNVDTGVHPDLISSRFAYVSVSRASLDASIYTNNAASLGTDLSRDVSKAAAMEVSQSVGHAAADWSQGISM